MTATIVERKPVTSTARRPRPAKKPPLTTSPLVAFTERKALLDTLVVLVAALPTRPPLQILLGIKIVATRWGVTLSAFDYEVGITEKITGSGKGKALVPGRLLLDIVKSLDDGPVTLKVEGTRLSVQQGNLTFRLPLLPLADYPNLPAVDEEAYQTVTLTGEQLRELSRVTVAAGRDETLPVLTCVKLEFDETVRAYATDRYRLAVRTLRIKPDHFASVLVSAKTFAFIAKHFGGYEQVDVLMRYEDKRDGFLAVRSGTRTLTTRLGEGEFPNVRQIIPSADMATASAVLDTVEVTKAVKQVALVAARNAPVRLHLGEASRIEAGGADDAQASKVLTGAYNGEQEIAIAFNPQYLLDTLGAVAGRKGDVLVQMTGSTRPAVFTSPEDSERGFLFLLMPVRTSG